ncbi:MAG TPA: hypothetical protein DD687_16145 [Verrucomicrobiales bacterium]|nr:hypothetical protein [Verrucomicrobiales bacterium]HBP57460.1 hypothetical protein [Verrucomicrobiales bacterium]
MACVELQREGLELSQLNKPAFKITVRQVHSGEFKDASALLAPPRFEQERWGASIRRKGDDVAPGRRSRPRL